MNSTIETLRNRISLRKYSNRPISKEHIDIIIEGAMRAPTAGNMMMYSIIMVEDKEKKLTLSKTCDNQPFIADAPLVLIFVADMQRWYDFYKYSGVGEYCSEHNLQFRGPDKGDFLLAASDATIAAQNAVIAAEAVGIGSCYIGDIMENYEIHKELLGLPDWTFPVAMLCLGYYPEDSARIPRPRFDRKYIVFNENYKSLEDSDFKEMFENMEKRIDKSNSLGAKNLGQFMYARKTGSDFSIEMSRSVNEALKKWDGKEIE